MSLKKVNPGCSLYSQAYEHELKTGDYVIGFRIIPRCRKLCDSQLLNEKSLYISTNHAKLYFR